MTNEAGEATRFGVVLARLRKEKRLSQLALALQTEVSPRHISFLESGRSNPSRSMVHRLAATFEASPAVEDELLLAAGYAARPRTLAPRRSHDVTNNVVSNAIPIALEIERAGSIEAAITIARDALSRYGLQWFHAGVLRRSAAGGAPEIVMHREGCPALAWVAHNMDRKYRLHDPLVAAAMTLHRPFYWEEVLEGRRLNAKQRIIFHEAKEFRISSGFVVPIHRADGSVHAISCMGERVEARDPEAKAVSRVICTALLERFDDLLAGGTTLVTKPPLRSEVSNLLSWVLDGRDLAWIAGRTKMPEPAMGDLVTEACSTLGASDLMQAAMRARRYELLIAA